MLKECLTSFVLVCFVKVCILSNLIVCVENKIEHPTHQYSIESHPEGRVVKTEIHEFSSVPKTEKKFEFNSPEVILHTNNEGDSHHENALTVDFTKHSSDVHDYDHYNHYNPYYYDHRYEYYYHYKPKGRPLTQAEIEKNRRDRIDVFKDFARSFLNIGMNRNRRSI